VGTRENAARIAAGAPVGASPGDVLRYLLMRQSAERPELTKHSRRAAKIAVSIGKSVGMPEGDLQDLAIAMPIHDIIKLAVPRGILDKAGPLDDAEIDEIRLHADDEVLEILLGRDLYEHPDLGFLVDIATNHHERYDGLGYHGLAGEEISPVARVAHIADDLEALTSPDRPYRSALSMEEALLLMTADVKAGGYGRRSFDPCMLRAFVSTLVASPAFEATPGNRAILASYASSDPMSDLSDGLRNRGNLLLKRTKEGDFARLTYRSDGGRKVLVSRQDGAGHDTWRAPSVARDVSYGLNGLSL